MRTIFANILGAICKLMVALPVSVLLTSTHASALTEDALAAQGYTPLSCLFRERCVIGQACEASWRDMRWMMNDEDGSAYRIREDGDAARRSMLMMDTRWKTTSKARAIVSPMREAVASQLTVFDGGGAILSIQYAANPGAGQFFLGTCEGAG